MRHHSHLNTAKAIIENYGGETPLAIHLKKYFASSKKYGSRDRKQISTLCYNFYRLGKALPGAAVEEKVIAAMFICEQTSNEFLDFHKPGWNSLITKPLAEKIEIAGLQPAEVFPWPGELSAGIEFEPFARSFLIQPDLFLRIRPGKKQTVINNLQGAGLSFELKREDCISLPNATKLDGILEMDKDVVVQDYNSQLVLDSIRNPEASVRYQVSGSKDPVSAWDCCAASGGKSILLYDIVDGNIDLAVSDIRESILSNLKKRFAVAGIKNYRSFIADLSTPGSRLPTPNSRLPTPGLLLCDAPCTGSGTWSRTPEQLHFFDLKTIGVYVQKQQEIVSSVIPRLENDGIFIYITCSVFKKENEEMVDFIKEKFHLQLLQVEFLKGYDKKADSMFVAVFKKP